MGINIEIGGLDNILGNLENISSKLDGAVQNGVAKGGKAIQAQCKGECPVGDTGHLRNSIVEETIGGDGKYTSEIGPTADYGIYVELGTGIYAGGRQTPWRYQDSKGQWHTTRGQRRHPYMEPGFEAGKDEAVEILTNEVQKAIN
mgnify:FL=1